MSSSVDLRALSAQLQPQLEAILTSPPPLPPGAQSFAAKGAKKLSLARSQSIGDLARGVRVLGLYQRRDQAIAAARVLEMVPFTGNYTIYEPIVWLYCGAVRLAFGTPQEASIAAEFDPYIVAPYGPTRHDMLGRASVQLRLDGGLLRYPYRNEPSSTLSITVSYGLAELCELDFMWAVGGSSAWPRTRIEEEINLNEEHLRSFPKMS